MNELELDPGDLSSAGGCDDDLLTIRVLIIDDQAHVRTWVRNVLTRLHITEVAEAANGREAMAAVRVPGARFDLILCDLRMPDGDGIETIRALSALGLEGGVVITSIEEERVIETAAMLAEAQGLRLLGTIAKPLTVEKLEPILARMRRVLVLPTPAKAHAPRADIGNSFARGELFMHYQPKVWMSTGKLAGAEALVRWKHPQLGLFQPSAFVPFMEQSDEYCESLTRFSAEAAIGCAKRWQEDGRELKVAINLAALAFDQIDLPERLESMCRAVSLPHELITLEVTETQVARDAIRMVDVATRLRLKGFTVSIDDFGTGQAGLSVLQRLPFSELKIDRQFVHGCATSATARSVVEASLGLARNLGMTSVAEGVQSRADWDLLADLGCDVVQGFLIARPMSEEGLEAWEAQWSLMRRA